MHNLFYPNSIAVVGVSETKSPKGFLLLTNILRSNYTGEIFLVDNTLKQIMGIPTFANAKDLPFGVDVAFVSLPASKVLSVVEDLGCKRVKNIVIMAGGFGEYDDKGKLLQSKLVKVASQYGVRILGPNSIGYMTNDSHGKAFQGILTSQKPLYGGVSLVSQSGSVITSCVQKGAKYKIGFQKLIHIGNQTDIDLVDTLKFLSKESKTSVIGVYIESIKKPKELIEVLSEISKPVIFLRPGFSQEGKSAIARHTLADYTNHLEGFYSIVDDLNLVRVDTLEDFFGCLTLFSHYQNMSAFGLGMVTNGGGIGVMASDSLAKCSLGWANLQSKTKFALSEIGIHHRAENPVDLGEMASEMEYEKAVKAMLTEKYVGALAIAVLPYQVTPTLSIVEDIVAITKKNPQKPVVLILPGNTDQELFDELSTLGLAFFDSTEIAIKALDKLYKFANTDKNPKIWDKPTKYLQKKQVDEILKMFVTSKKNGNGILDYESTRILAQKIGVGMPAFVKVEEPLSANLKLLLKGLTYPLRVKILRKEGKMELGVKYQTEILCKEKELTKVCKKYSTEEILIEEVAHGGLELGVEILEDVQFGKFLKIGLAQKYQGVCDKNIWMSIPCSRARITKMLRDRGYADVLVERVGESGLQRVIDVLYGLMFLAVSFDEQIFAVDVDSLWVSKGKVVLEDLSIHLKK